MKSIWFRRLERELPAISPHLRLKRVKLGFYRIYLKQAYIHECYEEMPPIGYDLENYDPRLESQSYYEEFEDQAELTRRIKNYIEGYYDSVNHIKNKVYLMRNSAEHYQRAEDAYKQMVVK